MRKARQVSTSALRLARVIKIYRDGQPTADLWFLDDGWRTRRAPIMCWTASNNTGELDPPAPDVAEDPIGGSTPSGRYAIAVVGVLRGLPSVMGFLPTSYRELLFRDRAIRLYSSDVYTSVDDAGNCERYHPAGASA